MALAATPRCRALASVSIVVAFVFAPAIAGDFVYDDLTLILRNPAMRDPLAALRAWFEPYWAGVGYWRPLTAVAIGLGNGLAGAAGVHALALALHVLATGLVFRIAEHLGGGIWRAAFAALLFGLNPLQVESVAWASAINDPLWALCALGAGEAWLASRGTLRIIGWTALALLAKENALVLPPALAIASCLRPATPRARLRFVALLSTVVVAYVVARMFVFGEVTAGFGRTPLDPTRETGFAAALLRLGAFARLLALPWPLTPFRPAPGPVTAAGVVAAAAWIAALVAVLRWTVGRDRRRFTLAALAIVLPVLPAVLRAGAIGAYPIADRYLYLPVAGLSLALSTRSAGRAGRLALTAAVLSCALLSLIQIRTWRDGASLVAHGLTIAPEDPNLHVMRGNRLLADRPGDPGERDSRALTAARRAFERAAELAGAGAATPDSIANRPLATAQVGLGWVAWIEQATRPRPSSAAAIAHFEAALGADPELPEAWIGLGVTRAAAGDVAAAEHALSRALELAPASVDAQFNLASLYARSGRLDAARACLRRTLELDPQHAAARALLDGLR